MIAKDLINYLIPPLMPDDEISKAIRWMEELHVNQLPVLDQKIFRGFIHEDTVLNLKKVYDSVKEYELDGQQCVVNENQHYYDVVRLAYENSSGLVAVTNGQEYLGVISVKDVIEAFAQTSSVNYPGGIIAISLKQIDYSLSEISRLIESENAKILSSYVTDDVDNPEMISLTLKLNTEDIERIMATLRRFDYHVEAHNMAIAGSVDKERLEILMKYLKF